MDIETTNDAIGQVEGEEMGVAVIPAPLTPAELAGARELVLRAHPRAVPELVGGSTVQELLDSVGPAEAAWSRVADALAAERPAPVVPAGGGVARLDPDLLPPVEKIRRGIARQG